MASTASSSNNSITPHGHSRMEAGPLPIKRGEIGYIEGTGGREDEGRNTSPEITLPTRHPADRELPPINTDTPPPIDNPVSPSSTPSSTSNSITKRRKVTTIRGCLVKTCLIFLCQVILFGGSITGWVLTTKTLAHNNVSLGPSSIFVHVIFGIAILGQLLFLERRIFRLRAERYSYLHPGEILPTSRHQLGSDVIAFSPWNRPPLPTYAATLAQSGVGTGDVEDHLIAAPPPPAYGNTRGSTMLLTGYMRDSLRAQRPTSQHSRTSEGERPISYVSRDEQWEEIQDAERARQLEETLTQLERPVSHP